MPRDPRYDILFEPVHIGPVTAPNRFYQNPSRHRLGWQRPQSGAALRGIKAEAAGVSSAPNTAQFIRRRTTAPMRFSPFGTTTTSRPLL